MANVQIAALLALAAALVAGVGYVILQRSAQQVTDEEVGHLTLLHLSLRHAQWWLGSAAALLSFSLQAAALALGSVVLVQSLQATALLFALLIDARLSHHRLTAGEWLWAVLLAGAVAVIVMAGSPAAGRAHASLSTWAEVAVVIVPAMLVCVVGARVCSGVVSAVLLAVVSAAALAVFTVLTKAVVAELGKGFATLIRTPELYAWLLVLPIGLMFQQSSFRAGALTASLPTITVARPVIASVLGVTVLGETLHTDRVAVSVLAVAVAVVVVATVALARDEAAMIEAETSGLGAAGQLAVS
ncbi:DMT family transporter [Mycobacterium haemophilum]|uniref:Membrane protein n=1 Tax=Mycobacterium haemophilum TaxID=29311 RepID=A0A0I9U1M9_9MYCO|nr:DMT family transporter [Mycobacterium haemophilum]KLO29494.1 membrane protein [Mycobacterium haemophilum]KLO35946.1 membrane protein [Mycobacterium haemophilum]KLO41504.1 membrane protein [Mycobacterium haemophilum]KLO49384.1 membrane protein [Mycobacterium haemophilum]